MSDYPFKPVLVYKNKNPETQLFIFLLRLTIKRVKKLNSIDIVNEFGYADFYNDV